MGNLDSRFQRWHQGKCRHRHPESELSAMQPFGQKHRQRSQSQCWQEVFPLEVSPTSAKGAQGNPSTPTALEIICSNQRYP